MGVEDGLKDPGVRVPADAGAVHALILVGQLLGSGEVLLPGGGHVGDAGLVEQGAVDVQVGHGAVERHSAQHAVIVAGHQQALLIVGDGLGGEVLAQVHRQGVEAAQERLLDDGHGGQCVGRRSGLQTLHDGIVATLAHDGHLDVLVLSHELLGHLGQEHAGVGIVGKNVPEHDLHRLVRSDVVGGVGGGLAAAAHATEHQGRHQEC